MKKYLAAISATALISVAPFAMAASSTDLTVTGTITPAACVPSFSEGGAIDLGKLAAKDLNPTTYTLISTPMKLTVQCDAPIKFALKEIDNNPGTAADNSTFGLGLTAANEKIGAFSALITNVNADGVVASAIDSANEGSTWSAARYTYPNRFLSVSAAGQTSPMNAQNVLMDLTVNVWISPSNRLTLTDEVPFNGSATFEMNYL